MILPGFEAFVKPKATHATKHKCKIGEFILLSCDAESLPMEDNQDRPMITFRK
jgi:hypothetical protein